MRLFLDSFSPRQDESILDIGGTPYNWNLIGWKNKIVLLNITSHSDTACPNNFIFVTGDGTDLQYPDKEFDIVFSNSVIEHVGSSQNQMKFSAEISRVGKRVWLQTPAREFFFEPHYLMPFIHWFSKKTQKKFIRNFSLWGLLSRPSQQLVNDTVDEINLLGYNEIKNLFPDYVIKKEKFLFMTKSYLVIKNSR